MREAERLVAHAANDDGMPATRRARPNRDVQALEEELSDALGATVKIRSGAKGKGKLVVEYRSLDQFEALARAAAPLNAAIERSAIGDRPR